MKMMEVLGGIGQQAMVDFEAQVHRVPLNLLPVQAYTGYHPMLVYY